MSISEYDRTMLNGIWLQLETLNNVMKPLLELLERQERREQERPAEEQRRREYERRFPTG